MKVIAALFCRVKLVLITHENNFILELILCMSVLINSLTLLLLVKELPDLVESILKLLGLI